jgi:hypothetical protein
MRDYSCEDARVVVLEMANELAFDMVAKHVVGNSYSLYTGYTK